MIETIDGQRGTVADLLALYIDLQPNAITVGESAFRRDVPHAMHEFRVATRRARSALTSFASSCGIADSVGNTIDELRWLGIELGAARDLEVQRARVAAALATLSPLSIDGPVEARVRTYFSAREVDARGRALAALDSARYSELLDSLSCITDGLRAAQGQGESAIDVVPQLLRHVTRTVVKRVNAIERTTVGFERDTRTHRARKAVKRLRYAIEVGRPLTPRETDRALQSFIELQNVLGEFQDSVVARQELAALAVAAEYHDESRETYIVLIELESAIADDQLQSLPAVWRRARWAGRSLRRKPGVHHTTSAPVMK